MKKPVIQSNEDRLRPFLIPAMLGIMTQAARTYGWTGDYREVARFILWCHKLGGQKPPELTPYD